MNNKELCGEVVIRRNFNKIVVVLGMFSLIIFFLLYSNAFGNSRDQFNYINMIQTLIDKGCTNTDGTPTIPNVEISFQQEICALSYVTKDVNTIYALQGSFSIFLKLVFLAVVALSIESSSTIKSRIIPFSMSLFVYFLRYFPLHEFTQIRVSLAIGFLMISIGFLIPISSVYSNSLPVLWRKQFQLLAFVSISAISVSLHNSIAPVIPFVLAAAQIRTKKNFLITISLASTTFVLFIGAFYLFTFNYFPQLLEQKVYENNYDDVNVFSIIKILDIASVVLAFRMIDFKIPIQVFCLSAMACSLILFYGVNIANLPTVYAFRLSEILGTFNVSLVASLQSRKQIFLLGTIILVASLRNFIFYLENSFFIPL
jgi:hypothetical protein